MLLFYSCNYHNCEFNAHNYGLCSTVLLLNIGLQFATIYF